MPHPASHSGAQHLTLLVKTHQGHIRAFLRRLCRNHALADDLAQDTFMRAFAQIHTLQDQSAEKAWLFQIAYRIFLDHVRKEKRRSGLAEENMLPAEAETQSQPHARLDLERAMNALPAGQRAALMLSLSYGLSHGEIARALGEPLGTVKSHISRGKNALRGFLHAYEQA